MLANTGVQVAVKATAADLGIDRGQLHKGKPKHANRKPAATRRLARLRKLAPAFQHRNIAKRMCITGALPQENYCNRAYGTNRQRSASRAGQLATMWASNGLDAAAQPSSR